MDTTMFGEELESGLTEISDVLTNASTCFDVWREMQDGPKRALYEPVVEAYPIFFETTVIAHLIAMSTLLYSLLETRRDTHNVPGLISAMRQTGKDGQALLAVEQRIKTLRPVWTKLARIRNEAFGHRSRRCSPMQIFSEIELLPEDIGRLIQELKDIARGLAGISGTIVSDALTLSATEDTASFMQALSGKNAS